jgi:hypothetical protein
MVAISYAYYLMVMRASVGRDDSRTTGAAKGLTEGKVRTGACVPNARCRP